MRENKNQPRSLDESIAKIEEQIKGQLENTTLISNVQFHHGNYFSMSYEVFNNESVKQMINQCCEETISRIKKQVSYIGKIERESSDSFYKERVSISPVTKDKRQVIYELLQVMKEGVRKYIANNENQRAIAYYKKIRQRRCRIS